MIKTQETKVLPNMGKFRNR